MNRRRIIPAGLASVVVIGLVIAAATGGLGGGDSGSTGRVVTTPTPGNRSPQRAVASHGSRGGAPDQPDPRVGSHPRVPPQMRTHPRLRPYAGNRETTFALSFRVRRNLGPHGHIRSYYGVIVSPLAGHLRHGCYGFGRYVTKGRKGQIARVGIHPRGRRWCVGTYQATVYLTGRPYCPPSRRSYHCPTSSYPARPTGWAYFSVR